MSRDDFNKEDIEKKNVLIVDDNKSNIDIIYSTLKDHCQLMVALDGASALNLIERKKPDMILLDVIMPGMNGYKVCRKLKSDNKTRSIPVIFISGKKESSSRSIGLELGAVDYIAKPFTSEDLLKRVLDHLYNKVPETTPAIKSGLSLDFSKSLFLQRNREMMIPDLLLRMAYSIESQGGLPEVHPLRVGLYSVILGKAVGIDSRSLNYLLYAAFLHDVGKTVIPSRILQKKDKLDFDEWEIIKTHTIAGKQILDGSDFPLIQLAARIAETHHEYWNGMGYPGQIQGDDIPLEGKICQLADSFDSMRSDKIYANGLDKKSVLQQLRKEKGLKYDPVLTDIFVSLSDEIFFLESEIRKLDDMRKIPQILKNHQIDYIPFSLL